MVYNRIRWYTWLIIRLSEVYIMAKVALSAKVSEELKAELEEQAREKNITLSEHVANLLTDSKNVSEKTERELNNLHKEIEAKNSQINNPLEKQINEQEFENLKKELDEKNYQIKNLLETQKNEQEFEHLKKELDEKNAQIKDLIEMQKNEQEIRLYQKKTLLMEQEQEQGKVSIINEPKNPNENIKPTKRWWQFWASID